ncbi:DsbA family oxidoreductase [Siminovitchia sp. FSL H7-0308]|uniref:DsbA family oxidoreductase n=1 Tax=Siminovitchia sp. FSL H7-0308 TaxID=2921432 RepID=UPI0030ED23FD
MKIEVWSDYACPFCYIGKRRLEKALSQFAHRDQVQVEFKSFELDPDAPRDTEKSNHERLAEKYGMTVEKAKQMGENIRQQAADEGLDFQFDTLVPTNTFDAHRLTHFAKKKGKGQELAEKLLYAYFTESKHLGDHAVLANIAEASGLDREEALAILKDDTAYAEEVRHDERAAQQMGVRGVPFFVMNQKYGISGAQPMQTFLNALQKVWNEEKQAPVLQDLGDEGIACGDEGCDIQNNPS